MIWSVSTLDRRSGTPMPVCWVNGSMAVAPRGGSAGGGQQVFRRRQSAPDGRGGGHARRDQVRPAALALPALEVAVRRRRAALARLQLVRVHAQAHRAAGLAPLGARGGEALVAALLLGGLADAHG